MVERWQYLEVAWYGGARAITLTPNWNIDIATWLEQNCPKARLKGHPETGASHWFIDKLSADNFQSAFYELLDHVGSQGWEAVGRGPGMGPSVLFKRRVT
mgnify:CR=1 FL=1